MEVRRLDAGSFEAFALCGTGWAAWHAGFAANGVAVAADTSHGTADDVAARDHAREAVATVLDACVDEPDSVSVYVRELEQARGGLYSSDRLVASIRHVSQKLSHARQQAPYPPATLQTTSLAAMMPTPDGLFVAWAGARARIYRRRDAAFEWLTPARPRTVSKEAWGSLPLGAVPALVGDDLRVTGDLGQGEADDLHTAVVPVRRGDLLCVCGGWPNSDDRAPPGGTILDLLAAYDDRFDRVLSALQSGGAGRWDWIPYVVVRCGVDLGG